MKKLLFAILRGLWILLLFLFSCNKSEEGQSPEDYSLSNWKFSVADNDWNDTLATPHESGFQYRIFFTSPMPPYTDKFFVLQHYLDDKLVKHQTVDRIDYGPDKTTYFFMNGAGRLDFLVYGSNAYTYGFPYEEINGVKVKNIFGR